MSEALVRSSGRRNDGAATKAQILEAAGLVFAQKGFDRATGKEIAERSGSNSAAVNYYYGGIEGLYAEVLVEAHRRLMSYDEMAAIAHASANPQDKLRGLIRLAVSATQGVAASAWGLRVLSREFLAPSPVFHVLQDRELLPKRQLVYEIVAGVVGRPVDDPLVARCCLSVMAPIAMLLVADPKVTAQSFPELGTGKAAADSLADHLLRFSLAGIAAVAGAPDGTSNDRT
jgi:TetR/AcrR family transcriptional regulator, regulator of cefoperazone and chloramphenicol sensitivity